MKHKVTCAICEKSERIHIDDDGEIPDSWRYYGKINVNACQTDKYFWKPKSVEAKPFLDDLEKVPNPCYDSSVKPKHAELWFCKECDEK